MMNAYSNFGEFISAKRAEKGITLRKMAELLDCSAPYLSDVEKDRRIPFDVEKLKLVAQILGLNTEEKSTMLNFAGKKG